MLCPKCRQEKLIDDSSSERILVRCPSCGLHLVNMENPQVKSTEVKRPIKQKWEGVK